MAYMKTCGIGRLTKDLSASTGKEGGQFTIAVDHGFGDKKSTDYWLCYVSQDILDHMLKAKVKKGSLIMIDGVPRNKSWKNETTGDYENISYITIKEWDYPPVSATKKESVETQSQTPSNNQSKGGNKAPSFSDFNGEYDPNDDTPY